MRMAVAPRRGRRPPGPVGADSGQGILSLASIRRASGRAMSHNNPNGERGTRWEVAVAEYLRLRGQHYAERRAKRGRRDAGDITGIPGWVIECKDEQRIDLSGYMDELRAELGNETAGGRGRPGRPQAFGAAVIKRRRSITGRAYVVMELEQFSALMNEAGY